MEETFWMVWCQVGGPPTYRHDTVESAKAEAERLAMKNPGTPFVVLQAIGSMRAPRAVEWKSFGEVPF